MYNCSLSIHSAGSRCTFLASARHTDRTAQGLTQDHAAGQHPKRSEQDGLSSRHRVKNSRVLRKCRLTVTAWSQCPTTVPWSQCSARGRPAQPPAQYAQFQVNHTQIHALPPSHPVNFSVSTSTPAEPEPSLATARTARRADASRHARTTSTSRYHWGTCTQRYAGHMRIV